MLTLFQVTIMPITTMITTTTITTDQSMDSTTSNHRNCQRIASIAITSITTSNPSSPWNQPQIDLITMATTMTPILSPLEEPDMCTRQSSNTNQHNRNAINYLYQIYMGKFGIRIELMFPMANALICFKNAHTKWLIL